MYQSMYPRQLREGRNLEHKTGQSRSLGNSPALDCSAPGPVEKSSVSWALLLTQHSETVSGGANLTSCLSQALGGLRQKSPPPASAECTPRCRPRSSDRGTRDRKMVRTFPVVPSSAMKNNIKLYLFLLRLLFKDLMVAFLPSSDETLATS